MCDPTVNTCETSAQATLQGAAPRLRILGVGSILRADDGVGVRVAEELMRRDLPVGVEVLDVGTAGLDLWCMLEGAESIIIIDAMNMGAPPGTVRWSTSEEVAASVHDAPVSLHEVGPAEVLSLARMLDKYLNISLCGIQPGSLDYGMELTPAVSASVSIAAELIVRQVEEMLG